LNIGLPRLWPRDAPFLFTVGAFRQCRFQWHFKPLDARLTADDWFISDFLFALIFFIIFFHRFPSFKIKALARPCLRSSLTGRGAFQNRGEVLSRLPPFLCSHGVRLNIGDRFIFTEPDALRTSIALFTLENLPGFHVEVDSSERTGRNAKFAADALLFIMLHNARLIIPSKGADRAYGTADGIFTLLTGHGDSYSLAFEGNDLDPG
jgi:hypothetical protein